MRSRKAIYPPISSTVGDFAQWLSEYTRLIDPPDTFYPRSPGESKGYYLLQPLELPDGEISGRPIALEMELLRMVEGREAPADDTSAFRGIRLTIMPFPAGQIQVATECTHPSAEPYFNRLLAAISRSWSLSPLAIEATGTGTPIETALQEAERGTTSRARPAAAEGVNESAATIVERITVPLERWDVYGHLRALCSNDPRFAILATAETDAELERLEIWDWHTIEQGNGTADSPTIGLVQLLPAGSSTIIAFLATDERNTLFHDFIHLVGRYFHELNSRQMQTEPPSTGKQPFPGFPKTEEGIEKWRKSYRVILRIQEKYQRLCDYGDTDDPNPSYDDLRDALARMPEWKKKPSWTTMRRIRRAGDEGLLA
jgi:hypothetical protein